MKRKYEVDKDKNKLQRIKNLLNLWHSSELTSSPFSSIFPPKGSRQPQVPAMNLVFCIQRIQSKYPESSGLWAKSAERADAGKLEWELYVTTQLTVSSIVFL